MTAQPEVFTIQEAFTQEPTLGDDPIINPESDVPGYLIVQAFNPVASESAWDVSFWDDGSDPDTFWAGPGAWHDIASRLRTVSWTRGCESPLDRPRVGTATVVLDNRDGEASPWNSHGEFSTDIGGDSGPSWLQPGTIVRFGAMFDDGHATPTITWLPFFTGRIESMEEDTDGLVDSWITLSLEEMTVDLSHYNAAEQSPRGTGDTLEERVERLLTDAQWLSDWVIDSDPIGDAATFQATTMAQNRLAEVYLTGDSVGMRVLAGSDGLLYLTSPYPLPEIQDTNVHSNQPVDDDYPIVSVKPYASTDRIVNVATAARAGGTEQTETDTYSVTTHGRLDNGSRDDLIVEDDETVRAVLAQTILNAASDSIGLESIQLDMDQDPVRSPFVMATHASTGLELRRPFNVRWVHPSSGNEFAISLVLEGFSQSITPTEPGAAMKWTASFSTATRIVNEIAYWSDGVSDTYWDVAFWSFLGAS